MTLWLDMTNSLHTWKAGVVGVVRAELEFAKNLHELKPDVRICVCVDSEIHEVPVESLDWLWRAENVADAYVERKKSGPFLDPAALLAASAEKGHPFASGDVMFSCGWITTEKEAVYARIKDGLPGLKLVYFVYDLILVLDQTRHFYPGEHADRFARYLQWVSEHCDHVLFGGRTAQEDAAEYWSARGMRVPPGTPIKLGGDISSSESRPTLQAVMRKYGFGSRYIIAVGSIEPRKNYETIIAAYTRLLQTYRSADIPDLVIVGGAFGSDVPAQIEKNRLARTRVHVMRPTDAELDVLYENALFSILPSVYEGWSLTLPEALGYGKFCLVSDVAPLREVGEDLVDYVAPLDPDAWADALHRCFTDPGYVHERAEKVKANWVAITWRDASEMVLGALAALG